MENVPLQKKKRKKKIKYCQECVTLGNAANLFAVSGRLLLLVAVKD